MIRIFSMVPEAVFNTYDGSTIPLQLTPMDTPNSFKNMATRPPWEIMDGSGQNVPRLRGSEVYGLQGKYQARAYWETVKYYAGWASRVNSGQTAPWGTDQKPFDLASASVNFAYSYETGAFRYNRFKGCKVAKATFSCKNDPANPFLMLDYDLIGSTPLPNALGGSAPTITDIPTPALSAYPKAPLTLQESVITWNGGAQNLFDGFSITIENKVKPYYDNSRFPNRIHCRGRKVTFSAHLLLQAAVDPRDTFYEAVAAIGSGLSILFTNPVIPGGDATPDTLKFDFRSKSFVDSLDEEMILDEDAYETITATAHLDTGTSDDFAITFTPAAA